MRLPFFVISVLLIFTGFFALVLCEKMQLDSNAIQLHFLKISKIIVDCAFLFQAAARFDFIIQTATATQADATATAVP